MSKEPVSTIIRSDAPHLVEVKPGSLNASSTKSWVEAGEVKPEDNIAVVALPDEAPNRQAVNAGAARVRIIKLPSRPQPDKPTDKSWPTMPWPATVRPCPMMPLKTSGLPCHPRRPSPRTMNPCPNRVR